MAQPPQQILSDIPLGGEFELPIIATGTTNELGVYFVEVYPDVDLEELAAGDPSLSLTVIASDGDEYTVGFRSHEPECFTIDPHETPRSDPLTLEAPVPSDVDVALVEAMSANDDDDLFGVCTREDEWDQPADVGKAYNHSTTGATMDFGLSLGASTSVSSALKLGVLGVEWRKDSTVEVSSTSETSFPTVTGAQRARVFQKEMEFARSACRVVGSVSRVYEAVRAVDVAGGSDAVAPAEPTPDFPDDNCVRYVGDDVTITSSQAQTFGDGVSLSEGTGEVDIGLDLSTQTGYTAEAAIVARPGTDDDGEIVPFELCGLYDDPEGRHPGPGLLLARDEPGTVYPPPGYVHSQEWIFDTEEQCREYGLVGVANGYWGNDFLCPLNDGPLGLYYELWVRYL